MTWQRESGLADSEEGSRWISELWKEPGFEPAVRRGGLRSRELEGQRQRRDEHEHATSWPLLTSYLLALLHAATCVLTWQSAFWRTCEKSIRTRRVLLFFIVVTGCSNCRSSASCRELISRWETVHSRCDSLTTVDFDYSRGSGF
ncbi:hypothetical protein MPTK2_8g15280 [Marchantia polymorpha subsp. ruderalis]